MWHVADVQEQHEQARVRDPPPWLAIRRRSGLATLALRRRPARSNQLERFDSLRHVVFEHLEILRREIGDRRAVDRHIGVEPHEVGAAAKARLLSCRVGGRREGLPAAATAEAASSNVSASERDGRSQSCGGDTAVASSA